MVVGLSVKQQPFVASGSVPLCVRPATQAGVAVPTQGQVRSVTKPVHPPGTVETDRAGIASARRAEGLGVPGRQWTLATGENSLPPPQKAPKL